MLFRSGGRGSYPVHLQRTYPRGRESLPGRFGDARDLAGEGEFTEGDAGHAELADVGARAAAQGAAVANARRRRVARKLLELLLRGKELLVGGRGVLERSLQFGAGGGEFGGELDALFIAL